jgi:uncharacterized membrane protein
LTEYHKIDERMKTQVKELIIETLRKQKPESGEQLIQLIKQNSKFSVEEINGILIELQNDDKITFTEKLEMLNYTKSSLFLKNFASFLIIILALITAASVFLIPNDDLPIVYVRWILGLNIILFLPGYAFIKALFPMKRAPVATNSEKLDMLEVVGLSIGMSLSFIPIVGLILNYASIGIGTAPMILTLVSLTLIFATTSTIREHNQRILAKKPDYNIKEKLIGGSSQ